MVQAVRNHVNATYRSYLKRTNNLRAPGLGMANLTTLLMHLPLTPLQEDEP